jgi:prepilin-type N-terminal cleavage/methylation domain-containing protein
MTIEAELKMTIRSEKNMKTSKIYSGFTLIELVVVVVILAIAAAMAVPMFSGAAGFQTQSAANMIAADLEYAKSMAISRQQQYGIVFDPDAGTYQVVDQNNTVIQHPIKAGFQYVVNFRSDSRLNSVNLATANFDGTNTIKFDYLGSPYNGNGTSLNSGTITLQGGGSTMTIIVEPVTGYIRIQ